MTLLQRTSVPLLACTMVLGGCAATTPTFDAAFGDSVRQITAQQVRHPDAPVANRDRNADGIDGRTARETMERYVKGAIEPTRTAPIFSFGSGSDSGGDR